MYALPERGLQVDFKLTVVDERTYVLETLEGAANITRLSAHGDFRALEIPGIAPEPGPSPIGVRPGGTRLSWAVSASTSASGHAAFRDYSHAGGMSAMIYLQVISTSEIP